MDWAGLFVPETPVAELLLRSSMIYFVLFFALRFFLKRNTGEIGVADLLVIILVTEAAQNAMAPEMSSITEAVLVIGTILFWSWLLNWLSFRVPALRFLTGGKPLELVKDGAMNRRNMRREMITPDELMSQLRQQGIDDLALVRSMCLEGDGNFSVIRADDGEVPGPSGASHLA